MDLLNKQFGERLKYIRQANKLTQKELASKTNLTPQVISNLERGYTKSISYQDLVSLATHLSCNIGDLIDDADKHSLDNIATIDLYVYLTQILDLLGTYDNLKLQGNPIDQDTRAIFHTLLKSMIDIAHIKSMNKS